MTSKQDLEFLGGDRSPKSVLGASFFDSDGYDDFLPGKAALAVGVASLGGAVAAAAASRLVVLRERGRCRMPWEPKGRNSGGNLPLTSAEWNSSFEPSSSGRLRGGGLKALGKVRRGGCVNSIRGEVWPFLLGLYDSHSTKAERESERGRREQQFQELLRLARVISRKAQRLEEEKRRREEAEARERVRAKERERERERQRGKGVREEKGKRGGSEDREGELEQEGVLVEASDVSEGSGKGEERVHEAQEGGDEEGRGGEVFSDAVAVSGPSSLAASTESFVNVPAAEEADSAASVADSAASVAGSLFPPERESELADWEEGEEGEEAGRSEGEWKGVPGAYHADGDAAGAEVDSDELDREWVELGPRIPQAFRCTEDKGAEKQSEGRRGTTNESEKESALESFLVWKRIMRLDAVRMNAQWVPFSAQASFSDEEAEQLVEETSLSNFEHLSAAQRTHAGRLVRILEAYAVHDPEIGYCQGMTDLLSPFVALILDDADAFWCFARFMETARHNFRTDEVGIRKQLDMVSRILEVCDPELFGHLRELGAQDCIFAYRMVIVLLRRELLFEQTIGLWEVLWAEAAAAAAADATAAAAASVGATISIGSGPYSMPPARSDFFLFVIAAIIASRRKAILQCEGLDEVLRFCNSLAGELDIWELIRLARGLVSLAQARA